MSDWQTTRPPRSERTAYQPKGDVCHIISNQPISQSQVPSLVPSLVLSQSHYVFSRSVNKPDLSKDPPLNGLAVPVQVQPQGEWGLRAADLIRQQATQRETNIGQPQQIVVAVKKKTTTTPQNPEQIIEQEVFDEDEECNSVGSAETRDSWSEWMEDRKKKWDDLDAEGNELYGEYYQYYLHFHQREGESSEDYLERRCALSIKQFWREMTDVVEQWINGDSAPLPESA